MTYLGVNPNTNLRRFTSVKPVSSYPEEILKEIKLLSFSRNKLATPFGSFIYRLQRWPGDVDLVEEFTECCSLNEAITKFVASLKRITKKIIASKLHYFSEFKAGIDARYDIDIGKMTNGFYSPNVNLKNITYNLFKKKLLTEEENNIIQYILSQPRKLHTVADMTLGPNEYDTITYIFRERRILRWSANEILAGVKILPGNKKISLKEALGHESHVKIDMISNVNGRLVEITNFLQLGYEDKTGEMHLININLKENHNIPVELPKEIEKLYFSNMFYSPFKMVKRMYSLARHNTDRELLDKIIPFVSSNISLLYQIKSEIDTIILVIERTKSYPKKLIVNELDNAKLKISTILELSNEDLLQINDMVDEINNETTKYDKIALLKNLKKLLVSYINFETIKYLERVGLNPPPNKYLPPKHIYNTNHIRGVAEIPENPFSAYQQIIKTLGNSILYPKTMNKRGGYYPNFFQDPNSSAILSQKIISNPGLNQIPKADLLRKQITEEELETRLKSQLLAAGGIGTKKGAWWASFVKRHFNETGEFPMISYDDFKKLFSKTKKYDYNRMYKKIVDNINFLPSDEIVPEIIRTPKREPMYIADPMYITGPMLEEPSIELGEQPAAQVAATPREWLPREIPAIQKAIPWDRLLDRCEGRTDKFIDHLLNMQSPYQPSRHEPIEAEIQTYGPGPSKPPTPPGPMPMTKTLTNEEKEEMKKRREGAQKKQEEEKKGPRELMMEELKKKIKPFEGQGKIGGYAYSYNCHIPLYMNENLPVPKLQQNEMHLHPQSSSSYASDYYERGYGPSLKAINIQNAPLVMNGYIIPNTQRAGCDSCGLKEFRGQH